MVLMNKFVSTAWYMPILRLRPEALITALQICKCD